MIETLSLTTITLARMLGVFLVVIAIAILRAPLIFMRIREDMEALPTLPFLTGVIATVLGLLLVAFHNQWNDPLAILVTLCGWLILFTGLIALVAPDLLLRVVARISSRTRLRTGAFAALGVGMLLLLLGLLARATISA